MADELDIGLHAEFERVSSMERTAGGMLVAALPGRIREATRVSVLSDLLAKDLSRCEADKLSSFVAATIIGWLGDIPRAQIALLAAGYSGPAETLAAAAIDAGAGLAFWCASPDRAEEWRTHVDTEGAGYRTRAELAALARHAVASHSMSAAPKAIDPAALEQKWRGWYTDFSMPKHANPLMLKETRTRRVTNGTRMSSGPAYSPEIADRAAKALHASMTMFYAASLAAFDLLGLKPRAPFLDSFAELAFQESAGNQR